MDAGLAAIYRGKAAGSNSIIPDRGAAGSAAGFSGSARKGWGDIGLFPLDRRPR